MREFVAVVAFGGGGKDLSSASSSSSSTVENESLWPVILRVSRAQH